MGCAPSSQTDVKIATTVAVDAPIPLEEEDPKTPGRRGTMEIARAMVHDANGSEDIHKLHQEHTPMAGSFILDAKKGAENNLAELAKIQEKLKRQTSFVS